MRVEANISVSKTDELGTKVEVKNLNSFKSVEGAIAYEIKRQTELLEKGEELQQETRGWDEVKLRTFTQRSKETAKDYRYFPDPDLTKMDISQVRLSENLPKLPNEIRVSYRELGLKQDQIEIIISDKDKLRFFENLLEIENFNEPVLAANYLTSDLATVIETAGRSLSDYSIEHYAELLEMVADKEINSRVAKDLLPELFIGSQSPKMLVEERG